MGLGLEVGILADLKEADEEGYAHFKDQFGVLNQVLSGAGLAAHVEPEELDDVFSCGMYGYSGLHYLRRIGAYLALGRPNPPPGDKEAADDPVLARDYWERFCAGERLKYQQRRLLSHIDHCAAAHQSTLSPYGASVFQSICIKQLGRRLRVWRGVESPRLRGDGSGYAHDSVVPVRGYGLNRGEIVVGLCSRSTQRAEWTQAEFSGKKA